MQSLGQLVRTQRQAKKWPLRRLASELGVSAAYVADIEAERRLPSADLKERISTVLGISVDDLAASDSRLSTDLRDWIEERPQLTSLLRSLRASPEADSVIQRLSRLVTRRTRPVAARTLLVTWESELRAMGAEATAWSIETGGDLFGRWNNLPTVLLATKAGPAAQRDNAHFQLDVNYLRQLSETLALDWSMRYFGDWHSHHRLGLTGPSAGDRRRIVSVAQRNQFTGMAEVIVTLEASRGEPTVRINPWLYDFSAGDGAPVPLGIKVLPGISPIREALIARRVLPEQALAAWEKIPLQRIRVGPDMGPPALETTYEVDASTRDTAISHLVKALQEASGHPVERHPTGFGSVLVARIDENHYLAYALSAAWPMPVLEVHLLDRGPGTSLPVHTPFELSALDVSRVLALYHEAARDYAGSTDVD